MTLGSETELSRAPEGPSERDAARAITALKAAERAHQEAEEALARAEPRDRAAARERASAALAAAVTARERFLAAARESW